MGRQPKSYSQADRLMEMVRTLASRAVTVNELAESFAITRRQVYRDLPPFYFGGVVLSFLPSTFQTRCSSTTPPAYLTRI